MNKRYQSRIPLAALVLIVALAGGVRVFTLVEHSRSPLSTHLRLDEEVYDEWGREAEEGRLFLDYVPNHGPGYPWLLGLIYKIAGHRLLGVRLIQMALGLGSMVLVFLVARRLTDPPAALISALLFGLYWPLIVFEQRLLAVTWFTFLNLAGLTLALAAEKKRAKFLWPLAGFIIGFSVLVRPNSLIWMLAIILWLGARAAVKRETRALVFAGRFALGAAIVLGPVMLKNHQLSGHWIIQANSGMNFYLGNNPAADGAPYARPGGTWDAIQALPISEANIVDQAGQDRFYLEKVFQFMRDQPVAFLRGLGVKSLLVVNQREVRATIDPEFQRRQLRALQLPLPGFSLIFATALAGLLVLRGQREDHQLFILYLVAHALTLVISVVSSRYRLPLAAGLTALSGAGVLAVIRPDGAKRIAALVLVVLGLALSFLPVAPSSSDAEELAALGDAWLGRGQRAQALDHYQQALAEEPDYAAAMIGLARIELKDHDSAAALKWYEKAKTADPKSASARLQWGMALWESGDREAAIREMRVALELRPQWISAIYTLAYYEHVAGNDDRAVSLLDEALKLRPGFEDAKLLLQDLRR